MKAIMPLRAGETALNNAPYANLGDKLQCIPQHYLTFSHTIESVESLILDIEFSERYPIFVNEDNSGLFIQVGIIGFDNYLPKTTQTNAKIVYGRKWRVEPQLPSSEIIQTAFLAIKKAREHEIRELMQLQLMDSKTTPFNNHHDLPLLVSCPQLQCKDQNTETSLTVAFNQLDMTLKQFNYDGAEFELLNLEPRPNNNWLVEIKINGTQQTSLPELVHSPYMSFSIPKLNVNYCVHKLMAELIQLSDQYVDENFKYKGVTRFSWQTDINHIAELSVVTRKLHQQSEFREFEQEWSQNNYNTDLSRVPKLNNSKLSQKIQSVLNGFGDLNGIPPLFAR